MAENSKALFEDLGKPTMRGVRKCPKCGILNGSRGLSCKNKECGIVFKIPKEKVLEPVVDAVKINCSSELQIYSVKLHNTNDTFRCFVHLPVIEGIEALKDADEVKVIKQSAAMCYALSCRKPFDEVGSITLNLNPCVHTQFIVNCTLEAEPLAVKKGVIKVIPLSEEIKQEILTMLSETDDCLVQRISKNILVVKCSPQIKHPLGFLHFALFEPVKNCRKFKIMCECQSQNIKPFIPKEKHMCLHFYLAVCAFASDVKLLEEFKVLIQDVLKIKSLDSPESSKKASEPAPDLTDLKAFFSDVINTSTKKRKIDNRNAVDLEADILRTLKNLKKDCSPEKKPCNDNPSINFEEWLESVTENINQTMHYQFDGSPDPLVFHVPQKFFDILQQRISFGLKKKRLPNTVVAYTRKTSIPVGVFSKYTWCITNILHVKRIFDTQQVPLEITRSFIENRDGTYVPYNPAQGETEKLAENFRKTLNNLLIKPLELKTFLKVGNTAPNQKEPTPFVIEWTPDIFPKTHVGELKIKFEYGHLRNNAIEDRDKSQQCRR